MKTKENIRMQTSHDLESEQEHVMRSQIHVEQNCVQKKKKDNSEFSYAWISASLWCVWHWFVDGSCHIYTHSYVNESCHTHTHYVCIEYQRPRHPRPSFESCRTCECVMSHIYSFVCEQAMSHSFLCMCELDAKASAYRHIYSHAYVNESWHTHTHVCVY